MAFASVVLGVGWCSLGPKTRFPVLGAVGRQSRKDIGLKIRTPKSCSTREPQESLSRAFPLELDNFVPWLSEDFVTKEGWREVWDCREWGATRGGQRLKWHSDSAHSHPPTQREGVSLEAGVTENYKKLLVLGIPRWRWR